MSIGFTELLLIFVVILLLFGAKRIPELAKAFGRASFEYKKAKEILKKEAEDWAQTVENCAQAEDEKEKAIENKDA